ncbi:MAG: Gfo/Idh/MocA family protein [Candidatus Poribacteria bacterium]
MTSLPKIYRVGLVGCGGMGRHHLSVIKQLEEFELAALCDVVPDTLTRMGEEYNLKALYNDFEKMYDEMDLDIAVVATQTRGHCTPTVAALSRSISVLCEKPIAIDLIEADEMVDAADKSGAKLAINQQNHVNPGIRKAQAMVKDGVIGEVILVRGRNKAGRKSGNEFMEMGTHVTDMMMCFGGIPQWCSSTVYNQRRFAVPEDIMEAKEMSPGDRDSGLVMGTRAIAHYGFSTGCLGEIHFLGYRQGMSENYGVDILGETGQLAVRCSGGLKENLWHLPRPMEGTPAQLAEWQLVDLTDAGVEEPIVTMYRRLAEAIETDTQPPGSGEEGRFAFEMIMAIYQSHKEGGRRVEIPLVDRKHPLEQWRKSVEGKS